MSVFLVPDGVTTVKIADVTLSIKQKVIPDGARASRNVASWCRRGAPMKPLLPLGGDGKARGVVIHNTDDIATDPRTDPAEQYTRATWPNCHMSGAVVHFYVWHDSIWQNLRLDEQGWHAGDGSSRRSDGRGGYIGGNADCVAVECIGKDRESENTAAALAAWLLKTHGLGTENLYTHKFFSPKKNCPEYILDHWDAFVSRVKALMDADGPGEENAPESGYYPRCRYTGRSIVDGLKSVSANASFAERKRIAAANGISDYKGLASQNSALLELLKKGALKKP